MFLSVVHIYPQNPRWRNVGPMNYRFTVAAILASATYYRGSTEFDKTAVFLYAWQDIMTEVIKLLSKEKKGPQSKLWLWLKSYISQCWQYCSRCRLPLSPLLQSSLAVCIAAFIHFPLSKFSNRALFGHMYTRKTALANCDSLQTQTGRNFRNFKQQKQIVLQINWRWY